MALTRYKLKQGASLAGLAPGGNVGFVPFRDLTDVHIDMAKPLSLEYFELVKEPKVDKNKDDK
jgi:hypothetical protein